MRITIIYDNEVYTVGRGLEKDWGFSCLIETDHGDTILFDTGAKAEVLRANMETLGISFKDIDMVFISHCHWDHVGGLRYVVDGRKLKAYVPPSCFIPKDLSDSIIPVSDLIEIKPGVFTTGELAGIEQSLVLTSDKGNVVIVGCSHPGIRAILNAAEQFGTASAIIGGFHDFDDYVLLKGLAVIVPCHCTRHKGEIKARYPEHYMECGVGRVIEI